MKYLTVLFSAVLLTTTSCNKYEDGPGISFLSKKSRVANTWQIEKATNNGNDVTSDYEQYELKLTKDGDAELDAEYELGNFTGEFETDGTWKFTDDKETLILDFEEDDADKSYQILRLTKDEMWLRETGQEVELELKSA